MNLQTTILSHLAPVFMLGALLAALSSDVIEMRSGEILEGRYLGGTQNSVRVEVSGQTRVVPLADVIAITFGTRAAPAPAQPQPAAQAPAPVAAAIVPAGTSLMVRTRDPLDSNRSGAGARFTAVLEGNLNAGGQVIARQGSTVYGMITAAKRSGRLVGKSEMQITLTGISIGGNIVPIQTSSARAVSQSTAANTTGKVARGAAIGALANGSKGARKGAKIGAGAAILTRGSSIHIPPGTLLDFTLAAPLSQ